MPLPTGRALDASQELGSGEKIDAGRQGKDRRACRGWEDTYWLHKHLLARGSIYDCNCHFKNSRYKLLGVAKLPFSILAWLPMSRKMYWRSNRNSNMMGAAQFYLSSDGLADLHWIFNEALAGSWEWPLQIQRCAGGVRAIGDEANSDVRAIVTIPSSQRLAQDFQHMAAELGPFIQEAHAVVRQRHLARHGDVASANQSHIRDGVIGGATRAHGDEGGTGAGEAGDAVVMRGLKGFGQDQRRYDSIEPEGGTRWEPRGPREERLTCLGLWWILGAEAAIDVIWHVDETAFNGDLPVCVRKADAREPSVGTMRGDGCPFVPPREEDPAILLLDFLEVAFVQPHTAGDWFTEEMILGDQVLITPRKFLVHQAREIG
jgi:hypothetical protein